MSEPLNRPEPETPLDATAAKEAGGTRAEIAGRILFMLAGGVLLATLVSCACGPTR